MFGMKPRPTAAGQTPLGNAVCAALLLSLAANATFTGYFLFRSRASSSPQAAQSNPTSAIDSAAASHVPSHTTPATADVWRALDSESLSTLIARLRTAGFSPAAIRAVAGAKLRQRYTPRLEALRQAADDAPYWRPSPTGPSRSAEYYEQRSQVFREQSQAHRDLIATENLGASEATTTYQRRRFGDLSRSTIDAVERIEKDYADLIGEVRATARGIYLPEDRNTLALLEREKRQDLERLLTPDQFDDYDLRTSPLTSRLSRTLTLMDATEDEFQAIHEAYTPFRDTLFPGIDGTGYTWPSTADERQARLAVLQTLLPELGQARVMELLRASNSDFHLLASAAERGGYQLSTAQEAYDLRTATCLESIQIGNDRSRSLEERKAALRNLADLTRQRLVSLLGTQGEGYARSSSWLNTISSGGAVGFDGLTTTNYSLPPADPPRKGP